MVLKNNFLGVVKRIQAMKSAKNLQTGQKGKFKKRNTRNLIGEATIKIQRKRQNHYIVYSKRLVKF